MTKVFGVHFNRSLSFKYQEGINADSSCMRVSKDNILFQRVANIERLAGL